MSHTVQAPPRGLELFAWGRRARPLPSTGKRGLALEKLGLRTVQDLLQHYPRYHVDRTELRMVGDLRQMASEGFEGEVQVHAKVVKMNRPFKTRTGKKMIKGSIGDETGAIEVTWFNQEWILRSLKPGTVAFFYGKLGMFRGKLQMMSPRFELVRTGSEPFNVGRIIPIYPATADLSSDQLRRLMWETLERTDRILDPLPDETRNELRLMSRDEAIRLIHFPTAKRMFSKRAAG